ncbi:MAG TPA: Na+/H+ antiporter [Pseudorhodoplanes sp.]|jgi:CPA1 family monovalent cation:H+ antiporter|nr:Na+/H+ antiporter [Pseudorhodoplanes sp.]
MTGQIQTYLLMLGVLCAAAILARRLRTAPSILLVMAGVLLAVVPGIPRVELAPELVLLVILPPLIYSAGVAMSWREFRFNLRPITLLAVGCVIFTTCAVAAAAHYFLGLPWPVGFLLGAIVAPPDVVAPLAIVRRLGLPRRVLVILEGEGLANDATALILYRFAVAAVLTGSFSLMQASATFAAIVAGEIAWGIAVGWSSLHLRRWARDQRVEITLSLMTPYFAYWIPAHAGGSGVLATVACGLFVSWRGPLLISSATRLQGRFFWDLLVYLIEGLVFLVTGLQARILFESTKGLSIGELSVATLLVTAIVILARFVWIFPATYLPRAILLISRFDPAPNWRLPFIIGFTGVRGVVSLAAALAIPFTIENGEPFPYRSLIIFVVFGVILVTLVGQGLTLPAVVRWLGLARDVHEERSRERDAERAARIEIIEASKERLERLAADGKITPDQLALLRTRHERRREFLPNESADRLAETCSQFITDLIEEERVHLHRLLREGKITDEARRRIERELDLEEASIARRYDADELPL